MALVTSASLSTYVRAESTNENALMDTLVTQSIAIIETYIGRPIRSVSKTFIDDVELARRIIIPQYPLSGSVTLTDIDGNVVSSSDYTVRTQLGMVIADYGVSFDNGPYTIDCHVGLEHAQDYSSRIEPAINACILNIAADLYSRREPMVSSEGASETSVTYLGNDIPPRVESVLKQFRQTAIAR